MSLQILGTPSVTAAGAKEDVAAATQAWIAGAFPFSEDKNVVVLKKAEWNAGRLLHTQSKAADCFMVWGCDRSALSRVGRARRPIAILRVRGPA
jgi:hypothetical protein